MKEVGQLKRVPLREVWAREASDFTPWLERNIAVLGDRLGLELVNPIKEQTAGDLSIDLAADIGGGGRIIIENQLGKSDHGHLGQLITYLAVADATAAVWIVGEARPEHVAAIGKLNASGIADFYLVRVEAVQIGDSPPAPLLSLLTGPSNEIKAVAAAKQEDIERHAQRRQWWALLLARPDARLHRGLSPTKDTWIAKGSGVNGLTFNYVVNQHQCAAEFYIYRGAGSASENEAIFDQLLAHRTEIENASGGRLDWQRMDGKQGCRIRFDIAGGYRSPTENWDEIQEQQVDAMRRLHAAIMPQLAGLKLAPESGL